METILASTKTHCGPKDKKYRETLGSILSLLEVKVKRIILAGALVANVLSFVRVDVCECCLVFLRYVSSG